MTLDRRTVLLGAATMVSLGAAGAEKPEPPHRASGEAKERVLGIGGLFFRSRDPKALSDWYLEHLGIDPTPTQVNQPVWHQEAGPTVFAAFPMATKYFGAEKQSWMVNFRVRNLDAMVAQLRAARIAVEVDGTAYPNGRFARLNDPEGNPIELWEPADSEPRR